MKLPQNLIFLYLLYVLYILYEWYMYCMFIMYCVYYIMYWFNCLRFMYYMHCVYRFLKGELTSNFWWSFCIRNLYYVVSELWNRYLNHHPPIIGGIHHLQTRPLKGHFSLRFHVVMCLLVASCWILCTKEYGTRLPMTSATLRNMTS